MMTIVLKTGCTLLVIGGLTTTSVAGLSEGGPMVGFHEEAIMTASDSSVAGYLGWDVDFAESVLIAGAPRQGGGHAVVGYLNQWGALVSTDELAASDAVETDFFGWSVAIGGLGESGGVAFVGVPGWAREEAPLNSGAVYVFTPDSSGVPTEAGIITPTSGPLFRAYGNRLDFDGTRLAVGAFLESMEEDDAGQPIAGHGAVYVYDIGSDGLPTDEQRVVCEIPLQGQSLGFDVSLDGDQMAVSAPKDPTVVFNSGAVYHFERQSSNEWLQTQLIVPADLASADSYGTAVALVGDTLIVGCPDRDIIQEGDEEPTARLGVVYVYARVDGVFEEVQQIISPLPQAQSQWGLSLSFDGQHLVIGSPLWDNQNLLDDGFDTGLVAVYELGMDGTFTLGRVIAASDGEEDDGFAYSVAISEERVLIGSLEGSALDGDGTPNGGMAYIYRATCSGDIDGNGAIQPDDFIEVLAQWGETGVLPEDVVQDYEVGIYDLLTMLEYYGACN
ncbi:MAG: hypothetical protein P8I91_00070 [Phycisphaerales bacterium]|nr:hypothetical protein [Phycisphaerales bacterium]